MITKKLIFLMIMISFIFISCGTPSADKYPGFARKSIIMNENTVFNFYYQEEIWDVNVMRE